MTWRGDVMKVQISDHRVILSTDIVMQREDLGHLWGRGIFEILVGMGLDLEAQCDHHNH